MAGWLTNHCLYEDRNAFLQKHLLKCLAFASHSLLSAVLLASDVRRNTNFEFHTHYAIIDHVSYLGSSIAIQAT